MYLESGHEFESLMKSSKYVLQSSLLFFNYSEDLNPQIFYSSTGQFPGKVGTCW